MDTEKTYCGWCGLPENHWSNTFRWWSRGKRYCSARCFAAAEYQAHLVFAICGAPLLWFPILSFAASLLSEESTFYLFVSLFLITIAIAFTGFFVYMVAIGKEERKKVALEKYESLPSWKPL
jgi:hypothetical protein